MLGQTSILIDSHQIQSLSLRVQFKVSNSILFQFRKRGRSDHLQLHRNTYALYNRLLEKYKYEYSSPVITARKTMLDACLNAKVHHHCWTQLKISFYHIFNCFMIRFFFIISLNIYSVVYDKMIHESFLNRFLLHFSFTIQALAIQAQTM